jgi:predicted DNA-binding transcriptional regulator YafY
VLADTLCGGNRLLSRPEHWDKKRPLTEDEQLDAAKSNASEPSEPAARKLFLLAGLLYNKVVRYSDYFQEFDKDERSFQRDLQHLRIIGEKYGFTISKIKGKERAELIIEGGAKDAFVDAGKAAAELVKELGAALGGAAAAELGEGSGSTRNGFAHWVVPRMVERSKGKAIYDALKKAYNATPMPAIVEFVYDPGKGAKTLRKVEPYRVLLRSGRDYLLAYDLTRSEWRTFGLDSIATVPKRVGTIQKKRDIPPMYDKLDAVGFFRSGAATTDVTVELSPAVAQSVIGREWQAGQVVKKLTKGRAQITFQVTSVPEVVRWALGLGNEARVIAPESAVAVARTMVRDIAASYAIAE